MKKCCTVFILSIFTLMTTSEVNAQSLPFRRMCAQIQQSVERNDGSYFCSEINSHFVGTPTFVVSMCEDVVHKFSIDSENARSYCHDQFKEVAPEETPTVIRGMPNLKNRQSIIVRSEAMNQCEKKDADEFYCSVDTTLILPDLAGIMDRLTPLTGSVLATSQNFTPEKCQCLEESVKNSQEIMGPQYFEKSLKVEQKRVNDLIFNAAGEKIINNLAATMEDVNFYVTNNPSVLGAGWNSSQLLCNDFDDFQKRVTDVCAQTGVTSSVSNQRMKTLLNAFQNFDGSTSPKGLFNKLQNDIMNYQLDPSKVYPGRSSTFSRQEYDRFRFGVYKTSPEINFLNDVTDLLLDDDTLGPQILASMEDGKKPGQAIFGFLKDNKNPKTKEILENFLRGKEDHAFYKNLKAVLRSGNSRAFEEFIFSTVDLATDMHPSLKALYSHKELFMVTRDKMHETGNHSMIEALDSASGGIGVYFRQKCEHIKADFTEAVCAPDEDFLKRTKRADLNQLLSSVESQLNPALKDVILCRLDDSSNVDGIFTRLSFNMGDKLNQADYFQMKVEAKKGNSSTPATRFLRTAYGFQGGDAKTFKRLTEITRTGEEFKQLAKASDVKPEVNTPTQVETGKLQNILQNLTSNEDRTAAPPLPNYIAPQVTGGQSEVNKPKTDQIDTRSMLRDFLADKNNKDEVDRLLSQTSKADHDELLRLRSELESGKQRMNELLKESEKLRMDQLKKQYETLEKELAQTETAFQGKNVMRDDTSSSVAAGSASQVSTIASVRGSETTASVANSQPSTSGSSGGAPLTGRSIASESIAGSVGASDGEAIIIESIGVRRTEASAQADINSEVISYLQTSEPDIQTLTKLKEAGIILKFKVLENGQEILKELKVEYASLGAEARSLLEEKLSRQQKIQEMENVRRAYSFSALRHLLGIKTQTEVN